jgi:hypothetical protein
MRRQRSAEDELLLGMIKQQALESLRRKKNIFDSASGDESPLASSRRGSVQDLMTEDPLLQDYFVDITRQPLNPEKPELGWKKTVHRTREKKEI